MKDEGAINLFWDTYHFAGFGDLRCCNARFVNQAGVLNDQKHELLMLRSVH
jgi:hypothetical protein